MFFFQHALGPVDLAFTDRYGGVSAAPWQELNLAQADGDSDLAREENLRRVLAEFAPDCGLAEMRQVHGNRVALAGEELPEADALVTDRADLALLVRVADCVPVLLADPDAGVIAVAHAGRPGVETGVVPATVARMRELGAREIQAWVGPHVCGGCYEVPAELQERVVAAEPATEARTTWGTPALDIGAGVRAQLQRCEVLAHDVSVCTRESADLYSYRRDGAHAGRFAGIIRMHR